MAIAYWVGPGGPKGSRTSGDFSTGSNWSTGVAPTASQGQTDVYLPGGDYTVTLDGGATLRSLSIGDGATLSVNGGSATFELVRSSVNAGTLDLGSATTTIDEQLLNLGTMTAEAGDVRVNGGTIVNAGTIVSDEGQFGITSAIQNDAGGMIRSTSAMGLQGIVTNNGAIVADHGLIRFNPLSPGMLTNLSNGVLTGGSYAALGESDIVLYQTAIKRLASGTDVTLDGTGSNIAVVVNGSSVAIEDSLGSIDAGATLHVTGGRDYASGNALALAGTLDLGGGTFALPQLIAAQGSLVTGFGIVSGRAEIIGDVAATGTLTFGDRVTLSGAVSGQGTLALDGNSSTLRITALTVANLAINADVRLDVDLSYGRHLTASDHILDLGEHQLRLSGAAEFADVQLRGSGSGVLRVADGDITATGKSIIDVAIVNNGTIEVTDGDLLITRKVGGVGTLAIGDGGILDLADRVTLAAKQVVSFAEGDGTLRIGSPTGFHTELSAFAAGDTIDLSGLAIAGTTLRWAADDDGVGGTLRLSSGGRTARFHIADGHYTRADFVLADDGRGGTLVTVPNHAAMFADPHVAFEPVAAFLHEPLHPLHWTALA